MLSLFQIIGIGLLVWIAYWLWKNPGWWKTNMIKKRGIFLVPILYFWILRDAMGLELFGPIFPTSVIVKLCWSTGGYFALNHLLSQGDWEDKFHSPKIINDAIEESYTGKMCYLDDSKNMVCIPIGGISTPDGYFEPSENGCIICPRSQLLILRNRSILCRTSLKQYWTPEQLDIVDKDVANWIRMNPEKATPPYYVGRLPSEVLTKYQKVPRLVKTEHEDPDTGAISIDWNYDLNEKNMRVMSMAEVLHENGLLKFLVEEYKHLTQSTMGIATKTTDRFPIGQMPTSGLQKLYSLIKRGGKRPPKEYDMEELEEYP